jgi:hypothetical protein
MFGLLMIFGQIRAEPWYGKNSGHMQGLTTGPHHIQLTGRHLLSVPGPIAAQWHIRTAFNLVHKPQRACRSHGQTQRVGPHDALPSATLILAQTLEGVGVTARNFYRPAVAILVHEVLRAQGQIGREKGLDRRGRFALPRLLQTACGITSHHDVSDQPSGNTACHRPHQAWTSAPFSSGCGAQPLEVCAKVCGEPIRAPLLRGAPRCFGGGVGGTVESVALIGNRPTTWTASGTCWTESLVA